MQKLKWEIHWVAQQQIWTGRKNSELENKLIEIIQLKGHKGKKKEKLTKPKKPVRHHQLCQHKHNRSPRKGRGRTEGLFEEIMTENLPILMEKRLYLPKKFQWTPSKINSKR